MSVVTEKEPVQPRRVVAGVGLARVKDACAAISAAAIDLSVIQKTPAPEWDNPHNTPHPQSTADGLFMVAPLTDDTGGE